MTDDTDDIMSLLEEAAEVTKPVAADLGQLSVLANRMLDLEAKLLAAEAEMKTISESLRNVSEKEIPAMLDQLKIKSLKLADGRTLGLKETFVGKIPEDKRPAAFQWLEEQGLGTMVKTEVSAEFGMGQFDAAKGLAEELTQKGFVVNAKQSVAPATLGKFVRTRLTEGKEIPADLFNPMVLRRAKIS